MRQRSRKMTIKLFTSSASVGYSLRVQKLQGCKNMWTTTYSQKSQGLQPILLHGKRIMSNLVLSLCFEAKSAGHCRFCVSSSLFLKQMWLMHGHCYDGSRNFHIHCQPVRKPTSWLAVARDEDCDCTSQKRKHEASICWRHWRRHLAVVA